MSKPRSIFEEVSDANEGARDTPKTGAIERGSGGGGARGAIRLWLVLLFALVAIMVVVGGLTRLTDSGLSITEWAPFTGAMPPMDQAAWEAEFAKYQEIPEFKLQNSHMDLEAFKSIYWWEWGHRQLGRFIGLVWAIGFFGFLAARKIPNGWTGRLLLLGALGGLQGAIGWWMVSSGLTGDRVDVASYRLAVHLGLAFVILGFITWYVLLLGRKEASLMAARRLRERKLFGMGTGLLHLAFLQILLGALVAGIDAGRSFVDWPWMADQFFPPEAFDITPLWRNFFENAGLVQFMHRMVGYVLVIFAIVIWRASRKSGNQMVRTGFTLACLMVGAQAVLGITTVLQASPLHVAITHQIGAMLVWVLVLNARYLAGYPTEQSIRS
ncbi:COX15/CtaA family protein [Aliiroseovarius sp. S1123]|jgi:cytochrome c oxidase assembly protein subunit 15|uniref:heme A synthase n=1 Tax=unclassified Aliiroseovarius TaxID=2623558 RepID=UPI001FF675F9|nr:heme A synthase [Aliiroseovarius sp. S1123]MCK0170277.1 COX15/CtaA family protein [Aliiroseovarius sp. S1123]